MVFPKGVGKWFPVADVPRAVTCCHTGNGVSTAQPWGQGLLQAHSARRMEGWAGGSAPSWRGARTGWNRGTPSSLPHGRGGVEQTPQLTDLVPPPFLLGLRSISPFSNRHQQLSQRNNPACAHSHQLCPDPAQAAAAGAIWDTTATSCHRQG